MVRYSNKQRDLTDRKSKYTTPEEVMQAFQTEKENRIAREIFEYVNCLPNADYYISNGIMFKRAGRKFKFLSISTVGNKLLFHVPIQRRDEIYHTYKDTVSIDIPTDPRDKNQIDIQLVDIHSLKSVRELIQIAYNERE